MSGGSLLHPWNQAAGTPRWRFGRWVSFFEIMSTCYLRERNHRFQVSFRGGLKVRMDWPSGHLLQDNGYIQWWYLYVMVPYCIWDLYSIYNNNLMVFCSRMIIWLCSPYILYLEPNRPLFWVELSLKINDPAEVSWDGSLHWWILETFNFETHTYMFTINCNIYIYT